MAQMSQTGLASQHYSGPPISVNESGLLQQSIQKWIAACTDRALTDFI
jgi:hypothetical protein